MTTHTNILLVFADELRADALGCLWQYDLPHAQPRPHVDRGGDIDAGNLRGHVLTFFC